MKQERLHYHIGTKEDLLFDIQDRFALRSIARVTGVVEELSDRPIGDGFTATIRAHCAAMETERAGSRRLHRGADALPAPRALRERQKVSNEYIALMREVVRPPLPTNGSGPTESRHAGDRRGGQLDTPVVPRQWTV